MTILHVCSSIIININGLDIMVTLCVYFELNKIYVNYLLSILCPYDKFIQAILLYFLKLFQVTFIIILYYIILYISIFQMEEITTNVPKHTWETSSGDLPYNTFKTWIFFKKKSKNLNLKY